MNESEQNAAPEQGADFEPITSQDELNKVISERVARERKKFADYNDLKKKAAELDEIKSAQQTESDKSAQQIADLQTQLESVQLSALKSRIQARHHISDADAELFLTGSDEDTLTRQAEALAERATERMKKSPVVATQGNHPTQNADSDARSFARALFNRP